MVKKNGGIIISTPKKPSPQEDAFGNIYETHRSVWSKEELMELGIAFFIKDDISLICIISLDTQLISDFKKDLRILRKHSKTPSTIALKKILIKIPGYAGHIMVSYQEKTDLNLEAQINSKAT